MNIFKAGQDKVVACVFLGDGKGTDETQVFLSLISMININDKTTGTSGFFA